MGLGFGVSVHPVGARTCVAAFSWLVGIFVFCVPKLLGNRCHTTITIRTGEKEEVSRWVSGLRVPVSEKQLPICPNCCTFGFGGRITRSTMEN